MKKMGGSDLHSGLTNRSPKATDKSTSIPKGSTVNNDTTRSAVAPQPTPLGGRCC
jgi:hypothetical protein